MLLPDLVRKAARLIARPALLAGLGIALAGCGFKPLYGTTSAHSTVAADLASVRIAPVRSRIGQLIRNDLISTMRTRTADAPGRYRLEIVPEESESDMFVQEDSSVNRRSYSLRVNYSLYESGGNRLMDDGRVFSIISYDRVKSEFANIRALKTTKEQASRVAADDIRTALAAYFASR